MAKRTSLNYLKRRPKSLTALIFALILTTVSIAVTKQDEPTSLVQHHNPGMYTVVEFHDGDTITVDMNGAKEKIRFIGVDTPETHDPRKAVQCYGKSASEFTKTTIGNSPVRLEADPTNQNRDRYNRLLRYVYLPDGRLVNAEIIKQGYGFAYLSFPFQKSEEFRNLQTEARDSNRGLWGNCTPAENDFGGYTSNDAL